MQMLMEMQTTTTCLDEEALDKSFAANDFLSRDDNDDEDILNSQDSEEEVEALNDSEGSCSEGGNDELVVEEVIKVVPVCVSRQEQAFKGFISPKAAGASSLNMRGIFNEGFNSETKEGMAPKARRGSQYQQHSHGKKVF